MNVTNYITVPVLATFITVVGLYTFNYKKYTWGILVLALSTFMWCGHNIYIGEWLQAARLFVGGMIGVVTYWHWTKHEVQNKLHEPLSHKLKRWKEEGYAE